jgi:hypothetical protein
MSRTVAEFLVEALEKTGVKRVYGVVGDSLNGITQLIDLAKVSLAPPIGVCRLIADNVWAISSGHIRIQIDDVGHTCACAPRVARHSWPPEVW